MDWGCRLSNITTGKVVLDFRSFSSSSVDVATVMQLAGCNVWYWGKSRIKKSSVSATVFAEKTENYKSYIFKKCNN